MVDIRLSFFSSPATQAAGLNFPLTVWVKTDQIRENSIQKLWSCTDDGVLFVTVNCGPPFLLHLTHTSPPLSLVRLSFIARPLCTAANVFSSALQRAVKPILMGKDCIAQAQSGEIIKHLPYSIKYHTILLWTINIKNYTKNSHLLRLLSIRRSFFRSFFYPVGILYEG